MHNDKKAYQVDRTPTELLSDLLVQLKFLRQECLHYDAGDWSYGAQIATKLRLLLHQTKYSDSLLAQITKRFAFSCPDFLSLSTVRGELPNKGRTDFVRSPLIQYQMIHQPEVPPVLTVQPLSLEPGKRYAKRAFKTWWNGIDILLIDRQHFLNRGSGQSERQDFPVYYPGNRQTQSGSYFAGGVQSGGYFDLCHVKTVRISKQSGHWFRNSAGHCPPKTPARGTSASRQPKRTRFCHRGTWGQRTAGMEQCQYIRYRLETLL